MANFYQVGDLVRCQGTYTDINGLPIDPSNVFFSFKDPDDVITTYQFGIDSQLVKTSTGVYYCDVSITSVGTWWYRHYSTGIGQAADETSFVIPYSEFV